ncbi:conjugative transposon protein TraK [Maribacter polysaccharolyticus]|uniref:conjugative transposon protein TraK n=1 Tax=Maribacter polysaccharolyticus TaxID=3020831 RepID=UPI00237FC262|nr:conjugative transposon protein TraK [Maribacter polysaccharolyticus]MDE3744038.1 conjugative transposon protein TraK [Maribacter polysaccharolyticus]
MIKNIENKIKITMLTSILSFVAAIIIALGAIYISYVNSQEERQKIYVLDNGVPILIKRTQVQENRMVEYKSHINLFHHLFFTVPPDNDFIKKNIEQSMYLIDDSGLKEYNNLRERGFYNQILSSSAVLSIITDSVLVDPVTLNFNYYGKQRIDRKSSLIYRTLHTNGNLKEILRSENNPHGVLITDWRTVENKDIENKSKSNF